MCDKQTETFDDYFKKLFLIKKSKEQKPYNTFSIIYQLVLHSIKTLLCLL